jgi:hypothetical protein
MEALDNAAHQGVQPEQRVHLPKPLGHNTAPIGEHRFAAVADLATDDQFGEYGDMPARNQMQHVAQDRHPEPTGPDQAHQQPNQAERLRDMRGEPGGASEGDDQPNNAANGERQMHPKPSHCIGKASYDKPEGRCKAVVPYRQRVNVAHTLTGRLL